MRGDETGLVFRLNDDGAGPALLKEVFLERGWIEFDSECYGEQEWNLWWKTARFRTSEYNCLAPWQRVNHYPKATGITKKDSLARVIKLQQAVHGNLYNFVPLTFILPNDYRRFTGQFGAEKSSSPNPVLYWICKPTDMSRGRGIFILRELSELQYDTNSIIQTYISDPWLLGGYKFDMRLYVVVTSYHPLKIYLHNNGLVRFSTQKYDLCSLNNLYSHLTNTSINKFSPTYNEDKVGIGPGCKWTLKQLRHYFHQNHVDDNALWWKIISIVILTVIPQVQEVPSIDNCFELFGFDILIDRNMKPWLLEVNFSPSLSCDCTADIICKKDLLGDIIDLMNLDSRRDNPQHHETKVKTSRTTSYNARAQTSIPQQRYVRRKSSQRLPMVSSSTCLAAQSEAVSSRETSDDDSEMYEAPNIISCSLSSVRLTSEFSPMRSERENCCGDSSRQPLSRRIPFRASLRAPSIRPVTQSNSFKRTVLPLKRSTWNADSHVLNTKTVLLTTTEPAVVGGLHKIFPFNAITRRSSISPRQMVLETSKMIRKQLSQNSTVKQRGDSEKYDIVTPFPSLRGRV